MKRLKASVLDEVYQTVSKAEIDQVVDDFNEKHRHFWRLINDSDEVKMTVNFGIASELIVDKLSLISAKQVEKELKMFINKAEELKNYYKDYFYGDFESL